MRVLLVWPDSLNELIGWGDLGAIAEPLALEYLAAAVEARGHEAQILDLRLNPRALGPTLASFRPDLVGITAFSMHVLRALELCRIVKAHNSACRTVVGGHHATFLPEDFFSDSVDYVVCGEGCDAMAVLVDAGMGDPPPVKNMWRRKSCGTFALDSPGNWLDQRGLAQMPRPNRRLTEADRSRYFIDWMRPVALLRTTVGCPYRCTFCSIWKAAEGRYFVRDEGSVVEELAEIREDWVFLIDDEAFINGKRMCRLAKAIADSGIRKSYFTYCRIDTLLRVPEAVSAWRDIGLKRLFIGIDAISPKDLQEYNKKCSLDQIDRGLRMANELGVEIFAQFVVNTDYDRSDFQRLVRFIEHRRIQYPSFTVLTPLPGTDLLSNFDTVVARQSNGRPDWRLFDCQNAVTKTKLPPNEFRRQYRNLYHVFKGSYAEYRDHKTFVDDERVTPLQGGRSVAATTQELR